MPYLEDGETWSYDYGVHYPGMAENKPGHKKFTDYNLPDWVEHPLTYPDEGIVINPEDYAYYAGDGIGNINRWTMAHVGAVYGDMEILKLCSERELSIPDRSGITPCWYAVDAGNPWVVQWLFEQGADTTSPVQVKSRMVTPEGWADRSPHLQKEQVQWIKKALKGEFTAEDKIKAQEYNIKRGRPDDVPKECAEYQDGRMPVNRWYLYKDSEEWDAENPYPRPALESVWGKDLHGLDTVVQPGPKLAPAPLPVALLFPGQGSQMVGMMKKAKELPQVAEMMNKAKDILGWDVLSLCLNGPAAQLEDTYYCQPVMLLAGLAAVEVLKETHPEEVERCSAVAGLSLGEYTALVFSGVLSFEDGLRLVQRRADAMKRAAELKPQAMCSVAGLDNQIVENLCKEAVQKCGGDAVCQIANYLFPAGFTCSGTKEAIEMVCQLATAAKALQAKAIKTSGAFHCPLMQPAQDELEKAIDECVPRMQPPRCNIFMNTTGKKIRRGSDPKALVPMMKQQLTTSVMWEQSCKAMILDGIRNYFECGPNKQLTAMMKRIDADAFKRTKPIGV